MLLKLSSTKALWFGYKAGELPTVPFLDAIYMLMEAHGYSKEAVQKRFSDAGGDMLFVRMQTMHNPPTTEAKFEQNVRVYLEDFQKGGFTHPSLATVVEGDPESFVNVKDGAPYAKFIFNYLACK